MEKDFQRELMLGMGQYSDSLAYKISDFVVNTPFRGKKFNAGGKKPFDIFWIRPNQFFAIELKQCRKQSWNICRETDSTSLKEHQLQCLQVVAECGHYAYVLINFNVKITSALVKKYPDLVKKSRSKERVDLAFAVPIRDILKERDEGSETLPISWFLGKAYDLHTERIDGKRTWSPEAMLRSIDLEKLNQSLA